MAFRFNTAIEIVEVYKYVTNTQADQTRINVNRRERSKGIISSEETSPFQEMCAFAVWEKPPLRRRRHARFLPCPSCLQECHRPRPSIRPEKYGESVQVAKDGKDRNINAI